MITAYLAPDRPDSCLTAAKSVSPTGARQGPDRTRQCLTVPTVPTAKAQGAPPGASALRSAIRHSIACIAHTYKYAVLRILQYMDTKVLRIPQNCAYTEKKSIASVSMDTYVSMRRPGPDGPRT